MHQLLRAGLPGRRRGGAELKVELVADAAAALAVAALGAAGSGGPGDVELDEATGALIAPPAVFRAVVAGAAPPGRAAPHPLLAAAAAAVRAPAGRIAIEGGGPVVEAWAGPRAAALTAVGADGRVRLVPLPARALERSVILLAGLEHDADAPPGPAVTMRAGALAAVVADDPAAAAAAPVPGVRDYRRVARDEVVPDAVELVRADDGLRRMVASGAGVELRPVAAGELRAEVAALVAAAQRS